MQNIRPFEIALLAIFAVFAVLSLVMLSQFEGIIGGESNEYGERVVIWGPFSESAVSTMLHEIANVDDGFAVVEYFEKDPRTFETDFVDAIAEGVPPDLVIIPHEELVTLRTKLLPISYESFPERTFKDRFIDGAEIFTRSDGIYALPVAVDPVVMFWNRDLFSSASLSLPPRTWESFVANMVPRLTKRDSNGVILQSAVSFGEYQNVLNGKEILLTLIMQSGSRLIVETANSYDVALNEVNGNNTLSPMTAAVQFFTDFSNANSPLYSWNRALDSDEIAFLGGELATFFAPASTYKQIIQRNPNLNFDVAEIPQGASATIKRTYGTFYGMAVVRASNNPQGAYAAIQRILGDESSVTLINELGLAPTSRSLIANGTSDTNLQVSYDSALIARGWLDPDPETSDGVFGQMIDDIASNRLKVSNAVSDAIRRLELAF